jgi:hypothetical protein
MKRIALALLGVMVLGGAALAQDKPAPQRVKNIEIEAEQLQAELPTATDHRLTGRTPAEHGSLIKARTHFINEIVKSAEDL